MARPRSFDRDHVLHAAERQFRASGYNGTSVEDISAATGLGRGSLYAAFEGKHGVLLQSMAGYFARLGQGPPKALAGPDEGALERLHTYLLRAVHGVPLAPDVPPAPDRTAAACFAAKMAWRSAPTTPR
jgi:TetR/AcrR family transcriptional regulator, transcriptional repressor for nem operon